jgi:hypothetical protein
MFILPAVTLMGWIASWWGSRRLRWILLSIAAGMSVLCAVIGQDATGPGPDPQTIGCSPAFACADLRPVFVLVSGLLGLVCCLALAVLTLVVEFVVRVRRKASA